MTNKKILIAYYSHSGHTKAAAQLIKEATGGELFEIQPVNKYPKDYNEVVEQAKIEKANNTRPELIDNGNVKDYDVIFVGTPVWWYTLSPVVKTFLANNDFTGKIIVPFCTHGGGGASSTYSDIQKLVLGAQVLEGYASYETSADLNEIKSWLEGLDL